MSAEATKEETVENEQQDESRNKNEWNFNRQNTQMNQSTTTS